MTLYIQKSSGEREPFSMDKFTQSLQKAGAHEPLIKEISQALHKQLPLMHTSKQVYSFALNYLQDKNPVLASRYNLKKALYLLGPTGFPFEQFVAEIFKQQGYHTITDQIIQGKCVEHEIDIVAIKDNRHALVECKFHHSAGIKVDVTITLYVKARYDDIAATWHSETQPHKIHSIGVATNAKFTSEAIRYAQCTGIQLLGWSYPADHNLQTFINRYGLHPITALVTLNNQQKRLLIQEGLVFCRDASTRTHAIAKLAFSADQMQKFIQECQEICATRTAQ